MPAAVPVPFMEPAEPRPPLFQPPPAWVCRVLAGIDTGAAAALLILAWFALHSRLLGEPWWAKFNLAAAPIFGERVFVMGPGSATLVGASMLFLAYCLLATAYALLASKRGPFRAFLLAVLLMVCWHISADRWLWPMLDPFARTWFSWPATVPAHAAMAILLLRCPASYRSFRALTGTNGDRPESVAAGGAGAAAPSPAGEHAGAPGRPEPPPAADC